MKRPAEKAHVANVVLVVALSGRQRLRALWFGRVMVGCRLVTARYPGVVRLTVDAADG